MVRSYHVARRLKRMWRAHEGVDGLLHDKTPRRVPLPGHSAPQRRVWVRSLSIEKTLF